MKLYRMSTRIGGTALLLASVATGAVASSHREAPGITEIPKLDGTDFYMFRSYEPGREDFTTLIANYIPLQDPFGGPNYYTMDEDAFYEIHIDNDGDAIEDITFRFDFDNDLASDGNGLALEIGELTVPIPLRQAGPLTSGDASALNESETYTLTRIDGDRRSGEYAEVTASGGSSTFTKPVDNIGNKTLPNYVDYANDYIYEIGIPGCDTNGRVFVGQRAEGFYVALGETFDLINMVPLEGAVEDGLGDLVGAKNVTSLALEVPTACLTEGDDPVIGAWTTSSLPQVQIEDPSPTYEETAVLGGAFVQQSRLSSPLVNELVIGLPDKDLFNASEPMGDAELAFYVTNPTLPALIEVLFSDAFPNESNIAPTNIPRTDLVATFLTGFAGFNQPAEVTASEMLRLNTAIPPTPQGAQNPLGVVAEDVAGFPNGRRPGDDVVDVALRVAMGRLCYPVPLGAELGVEGAEEDMESDLINLGFCTPEDAPVGDEPFSDGVRYTAMHFQGGFPYLNTPLPGAPETYPSPNDPQ